MTQRPLSTALQHRIADNIVDVYERGDAVSLPLLVSHNDATSYLGDRPIATVDWACVWICPVAVSRNFAGVKIRGLARVYNELFDTVFFPAPTPKVDLQLRVVHRDGTRFSGLTIEDGAASPRYRPFSIDCPAPLSQGQTITVSLWVRSQSGVSSADVLGTIGAVAPGLLTATGTNPYQPAAGSEPNVDSLDLYATVPALERQESQYDHIMAMGASVKGSSNDRIATLPNAFENAPFAMSDGAEKLSLSYIQMRSLAIETRYDGSGLYRSVELRPNIPESSLIAQRHIMLQDEVYTRPGLLSIGSGGVTPPSGAGYPAGYRQAQPFMAGDAVETALLKTIAPVDAPATVTARLLLVGVHVILRSRFLAADGIGQAFDLATTAYWDLKLKLSQWQDGLGSVALGTTTFAATIPHYPSDVIGVSPMLLQQYWSFWRDGAEPFEWTYREGMMYPVDLSLITPVTIELAPGVDIDYALPVTIEVTGEYDSVKTPSWSGSSDPAERIAARLRLILAGCSIQRERTL